MRIGSTSYDGRTRRRRKILELSNRLCYSLDKERHLLVTGAPGATDRRRLAQSYVKLETAAQFDGPGRLFLCLMIIFASDGISETKRRQHKAGYCYQSFNRQHPLSPPFPDSLSGFYVHGGSQSLRRGRTAYHPGSPNGIVTYSGRNFNYTGFSRNINKSKNHNIILTSRSKSKALKPAILLDSRAKCPLFELNRPRRLTRQIIRHPVNPLHFINNPIHNPLQHRPRNLRALRRHKVNRLNRP